MSERMVELDGATVHVVVEGVPGPVVVLESGLGGGVLEWEFVAAALAPVCTVVRRDRPGLGLSRSASTAPRTALDAARALERLLRHLGLAGPYVLVGHSLGGLHVRAFAGLFPKDVAGVVLVDPSHEDVTLRVPILKFLTRLQVATFRLLLACGGVGRALLLRMFSRSLANECAKPLAPAVAEILRRNTELARGPGVLQAIGAEFLGLEATAEQLRALRLSAPFPPVPLRVISQGRKPGSRLMAGVLRTWQSLHGELAQLSPLGVHRIAERSGHLVPLEQPDLVVAAVKEVLELSTPRQ